MTDPKVSAVIERALVDPFHEVLDRSGALSFVEPSKDLVQSEADDLSDPDSLRSATMLGDVLSELSTDIFKRPIELVLRPHATVAQVVLTRIYQARTQPETMTIIERYGSDLVEKLEELRRYYRVYVETSAEDLLEKEASRLVKRFFGDDADENQKDFIKLKTFYEKIYSFQEIADNHWSDVQKLIDTFGIIAETRHIVKDLPNRYMPEINTLLRRTALFLLHLKNYANIEDQSVDPKTGILTARMVYTPEIRYTISAALGSHDDSLVSILDAESDPNTTEPTISDDVDSSIAQNIVLESRSRRFHRSNYFSVPLLGSRDWNRSPHYSLEISMVDFNDEMRMFRDAFHIILGRDDMEKLVQLNNLVSQRGIGAGRITEYTEHIIGILDEASSRLIDEDFAGIPHPHVFLYHIGPVSFRSILLNGLRTTHWGDIYFVNSLNQIERRLPEIVLQKILIDWWIERFESLDIEQVDSYLMYSRNKEMLRSEYLTVFEKAREIRRQEEPNESYRTFDAWLRKNRYRIFGIRRYEVFRRFFPDLLFNMNVTDDASLQLPSTLDS